MEMANSFGNQNQSGPPANGSFSYNGNYLNNRNSVPPVRNPIASPWFRYNPEVKAVWTAEEDAVVEECIVKFASDCNIARYAKIHKMVQDKSVREVAVRCKILMKKLNYRRRKVDRVSKGRKGKVNHPSASSSHLAGQPALNANGVVTSDNANGTSYSAIGGATKQLLQQNEQAFEQISANLKANKFHENVALLSQTRDNILKVLTNLNDTQEVAEFNRMPPFPVVMNEELIKVILPPRMNANHTNNL